MASNDSSERSSSGGAGSSDVGSSLATRRAFLGASSVAATAGLAGCFGGDGGDGSGSGGGDGSGSGDGDGEGETSGSAGEETVELVWWHQENVPARIDVFEELNQRFMDEHSNIEVRQEPQTWGDIYAKLQSALSSGTQPDFWFTTPVLAQEFQARGQLVDVSDIMSDLDSEYSYYSKPVENYNFDGGQYGIPNWNKGWMYFYRTDTFGELDWPPSSWQQWLDGMSQVTDAGNDRYGYVLAASNTHFCYKSVYQMLALKDAHVFGPDGKIMFDTENTVQMLDFYKQLWSQTVPDSAVNWSWPGWSRALRQGTSHSTTSYTAPIPAMDDPTNWAPMTQPEAVPAPDDGGPWGSGSRARWVSIDGVSVFNEDKKDAIGEYMRFIHRPDVYGWWMRTLNPTLFIPIHDAGWNADEYWKGAHSEQPMKQMVEIQHSLEDMAYPGFRQIHRDNDTYVGKGIGVVEGNFPLGTIVNRLVGQDQSPEEVAAWGQSHLEDVTGIGASSQV
jgi:multiple sugar transport system substrate-binding protein